MEVLKAGEYTHASVDVTGMIMSPVIVVPENIFYNDRPCLVIDAGCIEISSELIEYNKGMNYKTETNPAKLFDQYKVEL